MLVLANHYFIIRTTGIEWGPWGACSVTCGRGVRQRTKQCSSGYDPPIEEQETQTENCTGEQVCSEGTGNSNLFCSLRASS